MSPNRSRLARLGELVELVKLVKLVKLEELVSIESLEGPEHDSETQAAKVPECSLDVRNYDSYCCCGNCVKCPISNSGLIRDLVRAQGLC